eukprot:gnl/Chilomastix_cuspidata/936.p2 GENE.gnl/Chilomastix_cuspidata/936~~gnl/Chilomastix_cuspidata/936.p2  ORF type:complete len:362 (+),score=182.93 gnl/Chilomastix_cuspidata/936:577-1662(+)
MASYLVIGACGFIGQHLIKLLADGDAAYIRAVDKKLPGMCNFPPAIEEAFESPKVEFLQADILTDHLLAETFDRAEGFDFVVNLAAETKLGFNTDIYDEQITKVAIRAANRAASIKVKKFVHVSDAHVYAPSPAEKDEAAPLKPWTSVAEAHLKAEEAIRKIPGFPCVILRPAIVYGPRDVHGLMPRLVCGRIYKETGKTMKLMHHGAIALHTVHVRDVARAIVFALHRAEPGAVFNVSDETPFTIDDINAFMERRFGIATGFLGKVKNMAAKSAMGAATKHVNEMHMKPWSDLCLRAGCLNTPLSPYLHKELLYDSSLAVDGRALAAAGFAYEHPRVTDELLLEALDLAVAQKHFPEFRE